MIKCTNKDKELMLDFLKVNSSENCFFIGDLENFDLEADFMDFWKPKTNSSIDTLLMRYYNYYHIVSDNNNHIKDISNIIKQNKEAININGLENTIDNFKTHLSIKKIKKCFLAELTKETFKEVNSNYNLLKATVDDINDLFDFQKNIEEFDLDERSRESFGNEIKTNTGKTYFIKENGKIVSSATVTAENSCNGMIIGVATSPEYRKKGYAKACVSRICKEMIESDKNVLLFYDNPNAGKMYKNIGFKDINMWSMGQLN